jgi:hypothetical protein
MIIVASVIHSGCVLLVWFLLAVVDRGVFYDLLVAFKQRKLKKGFLRLFVWINLFGGQLLFLVYLSIFSVLVYF